MLHNRARAIIYNAPVAALVAAAAACNESLIRGALKVAVLSAYFGLLLALLVTSAQRTKLIVSGGELRVFLL